MPIYEYKCSTCGEFETVQSISAANATCPKCKKETNHRLISTCTFHLKGSDWASNNYGLKK
jgi:putative FmdB family regulatory protein